MEFPLKFASRHRNMILNPTALRGRPSDFSFHSIWLEFGQKMVRENEDWVQLNTTPKSLLRPCEFLNDDSTVMGDDDYSILVVRICMHGNSAACITPQYFSSASS